MKFTFKKIASVLASTVMLSSTVALAAAANYPSPFVKSGVADVAVVYGSNAAQTDLVAATDITTNLNSKIVASSGPTTVEGGDFVKLEKERSKFHLGDKMTDFWTNLQEDQLAKVLAEGMYTNDANNEFDYTQKIALGTNLQLTYFKDNDFNDGTPVVGFDLAASSQVMNYTLEFTPDAAEGGTSFEDLETSDLTMLGRTYYVVKAATTTSGVKLTLLDSANSATVTEGEAASIAVKGTNYDVSLTYISSTAVILKVNDVQTNKLAEGDVFKVGTDLYVGVKSILYNEKESGISKVEISLGSGKIVMENAQEVEINNEDVSDLTDSILKSYITNTTTNINKIVLEWTLDDETFIAPGTDLVLPGFETIKISMGGFNVPGKEVTTLENDGDDTLKLSTEIMDGAVDLGILYLNSSKTGFAGLGDSADDKLVTGLDSLKLNRSNNERYFVGSWKGTDDAESYVFEYKSIGSDAATNTTTIRNVAKGADYDIKVGDSKDIGEVRLTLNSANKATQVINVTVSRSGGSGNVYTNLIFTKDGMKIALPVDKLAAGATEGTLNISAQPTSWVANFTEENEDGDINVGSSFQETVTVTTDGPSVSGTSLTEYDQVKGSDVKVAMVQSPLATKTIRDTGADPDTLDVEYAGSESSADVYISETGAAVVSAEGGSSGKILPIKDSEASSVSTKNLVVVGGSCINSVAADLLGGALCGANFEAKTGVGAGSFLIETFSRGTTGVATLVAGYNAEDTSNAAKYMTTQDVDTTVGKKYKGTTSESAELVVG